MGVLLEFSDEQFQKELTSRCILSMELGQDRCAFSILDTQTNKVVYLLACGIPGTPTVIRMLSEVDKITSDRPWLLRAFESTRALIRGSRYTLVPRQLLERSMESNYLSILGFQNPSTICRSHPLEFTEADVVFDISNSIVEALQRNWPGIDIKSYDAIFTDVVGRGLQSDDMISAHLNVDGLTQCQLAVYKGRNLQFINTFSFSSAEDFIYYLLATLGALVIAPDSVNLKISGDIDKDSALYDGIYRYMRNVSFAGRNNDFNYSGFFADVAPHRFLNLIATLR